MMAVLVFFIAAVASFIGSLQAGLVNTAVLATSLSKGEHAGRMTAWGGALPELLYAGLAFVLAERSMHELPWFTRNAPLIAGVLLACMGIYFLYWPPLAMSTARPKALSASFGRGVVLGLMNPQLALFWLGVATSLHAFLPMASGPLVWTAFTLGAFVGALALLLPLVKLSRTLQQRLPPEQQYKLFRLVGLVLLIVGLLTLVRSVPLFVAGI